MASNLSAFSQRRAVQKNDSATTASEQTAQVKPPAKGETIMVSLRLTPEQWRRVKELSMNERRSIQQLAIAGLSRFFTDQGLKPL